MLTWEKGHDTGNRLNVWWRVLENPPFRRDRAWHWHSHLASPTQQRLAETIGTPRGNVSHHLGEHRELTPVSNHKTKWTCSAWGACPWAKRLRAHLVERVDPDYPGIGWPYPSQSIGWSGSVMWSYSIGFPGVTTKLFLFFWLLPTVTQQEKSHAFMPISGPKVSNIRDIYEKFPWRGAFLATDDGIYNLINKIRNVHCRVSIKTGLVVWPYPNICP